MLDKYKIMLYNLKMDVSNKRTNKAHTDKRLGYVPL